jgi:hypothetical protein
MSSTDITNVLKEGLKFAAGRVCRQGPCAEPGRLRTALAAGHDDPESFWAEQAAIAMLGCARIGATHSAKSGE